MSRRYAKGFALWWLFWPGLLPAQELIEDAAVEEPPIEEVTIFGEAAGPGLWKVRNGDNTLYILGTATPLPKKMQWRSREIEVVLDRAERMLPARGKVDADIGPIKAVQLYMQYRRLRGNDDKAELASVLSADEFARFERLRQKYAPRQRDMLKLRPVLAAGELWREAVARSGLTARNDINRTVEKLAKARKVPIVQPTLRIDDPKGLLTEVGEIPLAAELACMNSTLDRLEFDLATARQQAEAWALGDIDLLRSTSALTQRETCWSALMQSPKLAAARRDFDEAWLKLAYESLEKHSVSLAVVPLNELFKKNGVLTLMRDRGYLVEDP
jgi:uncharacterized protein YbaP (TraB family)